MNTLSNFDIIEICEKMKLPLNGIYFQDDLPDKPDKGFYIINIQSKDDSRNGTHWTALYFDNKTNLYYDSFGFLAPQELQSIIIPYIYNDRNIQNIKTSSCGFYCIAFIKFLNNINDKEKAFNMFLNLFDDDTTKNELILHDILYRMN
jgi:hypothetical protein